MSDEMKLLMAFIEASGFEVEEVHLPLEHFAISNWNNGGMTGERPTPSVDYKVTKKIQAPGDFSLSRRDCISVQASDKEIARLMPETLGDMAKELNRRDIIKYDENNCHDISYAYSDHHVAQLRQIIRYEYADNMIIASDK